MRVPLNDARIDLRRERLIQVSLAIEQIMFRVTRDRDN